MSELLCSNIIQGNINNNIWLIPNAALNLLLNLFVSSFMSVIKECQLNDRSSKNSNNPPMNLSSD